MNFHPPVRYMILMTRMHMKDIVKKTKKKNSSKCLTNWLSSDARMTSGLCSSVEDTEASSQIVMWSTSLFESHGYV